MPEPVPPGRHGFSYRLYYGRDGQRLVGYSNERGKGDYLHFLGREEPYTFVPVERLMDDFIARIELLRENADRQA